MNMITKNKWLLLAVVFSLAAQGVNGQDQQPQSKDTVLNVNDLAANFLSTWAKFD